MKTITIPESEYRQMQQTIQELQQQINLFRDNEFLTKLNLAYELFLKTSLDKKNRPISIKRGAGKNAITFIAEDFTAPLEEFKDYM